MDTSHRVVIVGGGFGGLYAATSLSHAPVKVTLIDRRNFHLFQPLLYQVATGSLSPANIAAPLRAILKKQKNAEVMLAEVIDVDATNRKVILSDGEAGEKDLPPRRENPSADDADNADSWVTARTRKQPRKKRG